jgi:transposase
MQETIRLWHNGFCLTSKIRPPEELMASHDIILRNHGKRKRLQRLAHRTRNKIVFRRCRIILDLAQRGHPEAIAAALGCKVCTVYRVRKAFLQSGEGALFPKKSPGRPRKLTPQQVQRLDATLACEPRTLGQNFSNWNAKQLSVHLNLAVHAVTVLRYLWRLQWRWLRPVRRIASPDPRYAAKARYLRRLRGQARTQKIHLYYADEMDVALLPTVSGRWMRRGQQTQVDTPGQNAKQYVFGAVNYVTGLLIALPWTNKNNVGFRQLLNQVLAFHAKDQSQVVVVVDNFRIHQAKAVKAWLQSHHTQLRLYFLPTYSPQFNPIERVWRHFRRNVTDNYFFRTMARLMAAVKAFISEMAESPEVILKIVA